MFEIGVLEFYHPHKIAKDKLKVLAEKVNNIMLFTFDKSYGNVCHAFFSFHLFP